MKTFPDEILGDRATPEQKQQRLSEISDWLRFFAEECRAIGGEIRYIPNAAALINHDYWELIEENVRPKIKSATGDEVTVDRHKICSLTELIIARIRSVEHTDSGKKDDLSARLAYYCALNILGCWDSRTVNDLYVSESFEREHTTWLRNINRCSEDFPIFSNAATWYLVEKLFLERHDRMSQMSG